MIKRLLKISPLIAMVALFCLSSCSKKEVLSPSSTDPVGQIQFTVGENSLGGLSVKGSMGVKGTFAAAPASVLANATSIAISYSDASGNIYTATSTLRGFNGSYISDPVSIKAGTYTLDQFNVINDNASSSNNIIAATPKRGSNAATYVQRPLSQTLTVNGNVTSNTTMEVVSVAGLTPQDFGYQSFRLNEIKLFAFLLNVQAYDASIDNNQGGYNAITGVSVSISRAGSVLNNTVTTRTTTVFSLPYGSENGSDLMTLVLSKSGYATKTITKTVAELSDYFEPKNGGKGAMVVVLEIDNTYGKVQTNPGISAKDILAKNFSVAGKSGVYWIDVDGNGPQPAFQTYCDMEHDGGGWMLVSAKFPASVLNGGGTANPNQWAGEGNGQNVSGTNRYSNDPIKDLTGDAMWSNGRGYTLSGAQLPSDRTQVAFGRNNDATYVGYSNFVYTTGDIASITVQNLRTGINATIYRNIIYGYNGNNESTYGPSNGMVGPYSNAFYYVQAGDNITVVPRSPTNSWLFYPNVYGLTPYNGGTPQGGRSLCDRGYVMRTSNYNDITSTPVLDSQLNYAWTVWVR